MAKALIGYMHSDLRTSPTHAIENRRLRARVAELEALVLRLKEENDTLTAANATAMLDLHSRELQEMQPV